MSILTENSGKNLKLNELTDNLKALREQRLDLIINSSDLRVISPAYLTTPHLPNYMSEAGVGLPIKDWELTPHAFRQWCAKFDVPSKYLSRIADWGESTQMQDLSMAIMNAHNKEYEKEILLRGFNDPDNNQVICRAVLSPSYSIIENYDVMISVFDALNTVRENHNIDFEVGTASLSDTNMRVRINMPQLKTVSEALLKDYRSPWSGQRGLDNPTLFMGIEIRNSEVGAGSFSLVPCIIVQVCDNGMTLQNDIFRKVHLGAPMEKGVVSQRTMQATMELISSQTVDKVLEIANPIFLEEKVNELLNLKNTVKPPTVVMDYLKDVFDDEVADGILNRFITDGDQSVFGVAQAITSFSQTDAVSVNDAMNLDDSALKHAQALVRA